MLKITRRSGEAVVLTLPDGRRVTVSVEEIRDGKKVRLGIQADRDVLIWRDDFGREKAEDLAKSR